MFETGLLGVIPLLWPLLAVADRRSMRACCLAARQSADWLLERLHFLQQGAIPDGHLLELAAGWRGMLARGARPRKLDLQLRPSEVNSASSCEFGLRLFEDLGTVPAPALTEMRLQRLPLPPAVVRAIAAAAPQLSVLHLGGYVLSDCADPPASQQSYDVLGGIQSLLRHAAPHLQWLYLDIHDTRTDGEMWLPALLLQCSRLTSLCLGRSTPSESLPALPQLTQLSLDIFDDDALPAMAHLRGLVGLDLVPCTLQPSGLQQLAGLTALKRLSISTFELPGRLAPYEDGGGGTTEPQQQPDTLPLPPMLESLTLADFIHPAALVALRLPDSLTELSLGEGIEVSRDDDDLDGDLRPEVATALLTACGKLHGRTTSVSLSLSWCKPPTSWPNRYSVLYDAVRQAAVRRLDLRHVTLTAADVAALVRQLPALEALYLTCHAPPYAWPLLGRLERLRVLRLCPGIGNTVENWEEFGSEPALRAALLSLCLEAPRLERLELALMSPYNDDETTAAFAAPARVHCKAAVTWLEGVLPRLRAIPPRIFCDEREGYSWGYIDEC